MTGDDEYLCSCPLVAHNKTHYIRNCVTFRKISDLVGRPDGVEMNM